ncbi:MAG: hypothetical protein WCG67_09725 [Ferruginibacter sp.]
MNPPDRKRDRYSVTNGEYYDLTRTTLSKMKKSHTPEEKKNQQKVSSAASHRLNEINERLIMPPPPLTEKNIAQMRTNDIFMNLIEQHDARQAASRNLPAAAVDINLALISSAKTLKDLSPEGISRLKAKAARASAKSSNDLSHEGSSRLKASKKPRTNTGGKINVYTGPKNGKYIIKNGVKVKSIERMATFMTQQGTDFNTTNQLRENRYNPDKTLFETTIYLEGKKVQMTRHYYFNEGSL